MALDSVLARITDNPKLPSPPTLTLRILEQASRPTCTIAEIGRIISFDPVLCCKMLKLVNSSLFGLQRAVTSIERALNLLGLNHVRSLVLSLSLTSLRFKHASSAQIKIYWKNSVTMAMVCREMAVRRRWLYFSTPSIAFLLTCRSLGCPCFAPRCVCCSPKAIMLCRQQLYLRSRPVACA